jgi:hypothetical protein
MPYLVGLLLCIACPPAAVLVVPTFLMLAVLQLVCGTIESVARASARRRLQALLAAELLERQRIEAATNRRSAFLRAMYSYGRPQGGTIIDHPMRLTDQRAAILGRLAAYILIAAFAALLFGVLR